MIAVVLIAGVSGFQVVRTAAMRLSSPEPTLWPGHPAVLLNQVMTETGRLAAGRQSLPMPLLRQVEEIARKVPLAPEPFLINGALAQIEGRGDHAEALYLEALGRDPRSTAARYFLADQYLRTGRIDLALIEMGALSRLTVGVGVFTPALAQYALRPGAVEQLRSFFRTYPEFERPVLTNLSTDAANSDVILNLWSGRHTPIAPGSTTPDWQKRILAAVVEKGDFKRAYDTWRRFAGLNQPYTGVFNPQFRSFAAPPPFNWTYGSQGGLAQPTSDGRLDVIYFGRDDAVLAHQLLLLGPGYYRLRMDVSGGLREVSGLAWSIECQPSGQQVMRLPLSQSNASSSRPEATFAVPPGCAAQLLKLTGLPGDFRKTTEFTVGNFKLTRLVNA